MKPRVMRAKAAKSKISVSRPKARVSNKPAANQLTSKLVAIGNSRGVRLPKAVIEQARLTDHITISVVGDQVILRAAQTSDPRADWQEQIKAALADQGDDVDEWHQWQNMSNAFDKEDWTW